MTRHKTQRAGGCRVRLARARLRESSDAARLVLLCTHHLFQVLAREGKAYVSCTVGLVWSVVIMSSLGEVEVVLVLLGADLKACLGCFVDSSNLE